MMLKKNYYAKKVKSKIQKAKKCLHEMNLNLIPSILYDIIYICNETVLFYCPILSSLCAIVITTQILLSITKLMPQLMHKNNQFWKNFYTKLVKQ